MNVRVIYFDFGTYLSFLSDEPRLKWRDMLTWSVRLLFVDVLHLSTRNAK